ncbi:unnamed protein product [Didymodactylos carnosus]|uniref:Uncharacterized protein n=1 Tax=Didymodactylos carnosus TaxID=1234261 RepID=A0A814LAP1_9BILA|nr:unnamed protein product [Didymodactylos carnosus]CAF1060833.1 unnamed protein product [Didymodactylos carnosus]CAF3666054.1 unnamed protein product [Didymodactylos carnosus]CAF3829173.1 unnamed protein product [Didymodactylos carnosus]
MPRVRVPIRRSGVRYATRPGARYASPPPRPYFPPPAAKNRGLAGLLGGLGGLLVCLLCLATLGLLGLFAAFIGVTAYLGGVYRALKKQVNSSSGLYVNVFILICALGFAYFNKIRRSI